jgi:hypothetical protein
MFVPKIDLNTYQLPSCDIMRQYYDAFLETCESDVVKRAFDEGKFKYNCPWGCKVSTDSSAYWAASVALVAYITKCGGK